jgi:eukaryotic-like serine/threonine-protein kinase
MAMAEELPVLVAALPKQQAIELEEASRVGRHVWVALKWPPGEAGPHMLEIYMPETNEPLRLLAEPLGTSSERGFALRVYPWEEESEADTPHALPEVAHDQFIGRTLAGGRFDIISALGEGSIGAVYRARHTGLGIVVAVKVLHEAFQRDSAFCQRFYAEALALSRLDHPNLIHIHDFGQDQGRDGLLYISMAFVDGFTLRAMVQREKKIPEMKRMVNIMLQVCAGLGHAHDRGLIHRDVKPDNVMIVKKEDDDGNITENVKVLDFGFAVPPETSGEVAQRLAGTPVYMSPEQCLGEELDARSDVYACGIMIYELSTGTVPFLGPDSETIRQMQVSQPAPLISAKRPNVDPRLDRLVQRALSKSREGRHPNMQELRAELKTLLSSSTTSATARRKSEHVDRSSNPGSVSVVPSRKTAPGPEIGDTSARATEDMSLPPDAIADELAKDASSWLGAVVHEKDPQALAKRLAHLDGAVRVLARRADVRTLQMVSAVVSGLSDRLEDTPTSAARQAVSTVTRLFVDPEILAPIAQRLLSSEDSRESAAELIADAGVAGAFALYGARTKLAPDQAARIAFVKTMKAMGEQSLPVIRAALERIRGPAMSGEPQAAVELAEDLLLSVPAVLDEVAGHLVVKYAECPVSHVRRATARALPRVWGERAKPTLLELLSHDEEGVRIASLVGLREIGGIDADAVTQIEQLFETETSDRVRAAAIAALESATDVAEAAKAAVRLR